MEELMGGVEDDRRLVIRDYLPDDDPAEVSTALDRLGALDTERLLDPAQVAAVLALPGEVDLETGLAARGYRLLGKIPRLPERAVARIISRYGYLQMVMRATPEDLESIKGVEADGSRTLKEGLERLAESSILDRYN
jgi:diadenylate cyclase